MTQWHIIHGDILDTRADGLLCSANPDLNLSGGVGGAFLLRYGDEIQIYLHDYLHKNKLRFLKPGEAMIAPACGSPYTAVAHAVSIDAFYDTNAELILATYQSAIKKLATAGCRSIAAACLGCGYGRCTPDEFAKAIESLIEINYDNVDSISFLTTNKELASQIARHL